MTTSPAPGTEPSDEAEIHHLAEFIHWHRPAGHECSMNDEHDLARAILASDWLAADRQRVAREAVEAALAGVEAGVAETLSRHSYDKSQARLGLAMAVKIIAASRERAGDG